eukprot:1721998-Alexandrium_andersonii.AAC.1
MRAASTSPPVACCVSSKASCSGGDGVSCTAENTRTCKAPSSESSCKLVPKSAGRSGDGTTLSETIHGPSC